jgi:glycine/D-amino acid oxidase-like deaminating enzyme
MMEEAVTKAVHRVPVIERARLRLLTPDDHGIRGHGFQHSPATGRVVAEWIVDGRPSMDLSLFDPARFDGRTPPLPGEAPEPGRPDAE